MTSTTKKIKGWKKTVMQDDSKAFWVKYRNESNKREIHIANQSYGKKFYVEQAWLTHKYKLFGTKKEAMAYAIDYMRAHPKG